MPAWVYAGLISVAIFLAGWIIVGVISAIKAITRLNTTMEFISPALTNVSASVKDLGIVVNRLIAQVAVLESATTQIPEMREAIARLETGLAGLNERF